MVNIMGRGTKKGMEKADGLLKESRAA